MVIQFPAPNKNEHDSSTYFLALILSSFKSATVASAVGRSPLGAELVLVLEELATPLLLAPRVCHIQPIEGTTTGSSGSDGAALLAVSLDSFFVVLSFEAGSDLFTGPGVKLLGPLRAEPRGSPLPAATSVDCR